MTIHPRRFSIAVAAAAAAAIAAGWRPPGYLIVWAAVTVVISVIVAWLGNRSQRRTVDVTGLAAEQIAEIEAHVRGLLPSPELAYTAPEHGWTCFHCGETFKTPGAARLHFGERPGLASEMPGHAQIDENTVRAPSR